MRLLYLKEQDDLEWMRARGLDRALREHANRGLTVGLCGGMQMLGLEITAPHGMEGKASAPCLGILPIRTIMQRDKITVNAEGTLGGPSLFGEKVHVDRFRGYETHIGETTYLPGGPVCKSQPRASNGSATQDGCVSENERTFGTTCTGFLTRTPFVMSFFEQHEPFTSSRPPRIFATGGSTENGPWIA
jgi:adenosylcobyric acid synthase